MRRGGRRSMARCVRASGGQGYFQHNSPGLSWGAAAEAQVGTSCVDAVLALSWGELTENRKQRQHVRPGFLFPKQEVVMDFVIFFTGIAAVACALYYLKKTNPNKPHAH